MAIYMTSSLSSTLEPKRKNRWVMQFASIPGNESKEEPLAFVAHTASRPSWSFTETEHQRLNERYYIAGKPTFNNLAMSFYDFIRGDDSAGSILNNWAKMIYNPLTGQMFFKKEYSTSATLAMLDPSGGIVEVWSLFYIWPQEVNYNDLSSEDDGPAEVNATFRYDFAVRSAETDTTP